MDKKQSNARKQVLCSLCVSGAQRPIARTLKTNIIKLNIIKVTYNQVWWPVTIGAHAGEQNYTVALQRHTGQTTLLQALTWGHKRSNDYSTTHFFGLPTFLIMSNNHFSTNEFLVSLKTMLSKKAYCGLLFMSVRRFLSKSDWSYARPGPPWSCTRNRISPDLWSRFTRNRADGWIKY